MDAANVTGEGKKLPKPNNIITIPVTPDFNFFKWWCIFMRPIVNLTDREVDVISSFLYYRNELSKRPYEPAVIDMLLMNDDTKKKVMKKCNITLEHFYVVMSTLRKKGVIVNNVINPRIIPNIRNDGSDVFQLMILFKGISQNELQGDY